MLYIFFDEGYGDLSIESPEGRLFTAFYVLSGVGLIGVAIGIVGGYVIEQQERFAKKVLEAAQELALGADSDSDSDEEELSEDLKSAQKIRQDARENLVADVGRCFKCMKRWLKIFLPMIVVLSIGMLVMMFSEEQLTFIDAFYWGIVTGTTVDRAFAVTMTANTK